MTSQVASRNRAKSSFANGAGSVRMTLKPFARNRQAQLDPMTPVPITATIMMAVLKAILWNRMISLS